MAHLCYFQGAPSGEKVTRCVDTQTVVVSHLLPTMLG